jgi:hypothetical protein
LGSKYQRAAATFFRLQRTPRRRLGYWKQSTLSLNPELIMTNDKASLSAPALLTDDARDDLIEQKITCPFLGSAVREGFLPVRGDAQHPVANVEEVRKIGNRGGGDLGEVLVLFAEGNHGFTSGASGKLTERVPADLFSLELPGSQGSHAGHSGILETDPNQPGSGKTSLENFGRLADRATKDGVIRRSDIGRFIAENLMRDPTSKVSLESVAGLLAADLAEIIEAGASAIWQRLFGVRQQPVEAHRDFERRLTKLMGEDNLVGSAGEFGLLMAFLANSPRTAILARDEDHKLPFDEEPALSLEEIRGMFIEKRLPPGWENWKKSRVDWIIHTTALIVSAAMEYAKLDKAD